MDEAYLTSIKNRFNNVITIEEGIVTGGFGEGVTAWLTLNGYKGNVKTIGLPDEYIEHGQRELLLKKFGVCQEAIIELVRSIKQLSKINI
tara:strand:- start:335 stop:604 length:270 start_codon:yes stop_codon:yes gene_type:complete